ncbi:MAG: SMP-30/gluconolactonase/LRE family protein, partial [Ramlibacter sp.]
MGAASVGSFEEIDPRFRRLAFPNVHVEKLYTGCRWAEGPAWFAAGRYLLWSDIPNDRMMRWDETDGSVSVFRQPAMNANGLTVDLQGRMIACEHRGRCVSRTEHDGSRTVLVDRHEGKRFNSPNDVVVKSDGTIWFTDPSYGIDSDYEGDAAPGEIGACNVYRFEPESGSCTVVASDFVQPNGLAFSPDESVLYIADTGATHRENGPHHVRRFDVDAGGASLSGGAVLSVCPVGLYDGFRVDVSGNLWMSAGDGVHCLASDGTL